MAAVECEPLRFVGQTHVLQGPVPEGWPTTGVLVGLELDAAGAESASVGFTALRGGRGHALRIHLPAWTPAGTYQGAVVLGEERRAIVAEVLTSRFLALRPSPVEIDAAPGGAVERSLVAQNAGNVTLELPEREYVGLFAARGLERSLGAAFMTRSAKGLERFGVLGDDLAASHGGVMKLQLRAGAGAIEPGEERELAITLRVPKEAAPGQSYFGYAHLSVGTFTVRCNVLTQEESS